MAVLPVVVYPDPRLKTVCAPIEPGDETIRIARDLLDTMNSVPGVGIAAPQIGELTRIVLVDAARNPRQDPGHGLMVLVNPVIVASDGKQVFKEGCLSVPQYLARIRRAQCVTVEAFTPEGKPLRIDAEGFEAVVLQHEIDHLDGVLFLDRIRDMKRDLYERKSSQQSAVSSQPEDAPHAGRS
ncbi:MAG TPA: peptide deformylase [Armatimonadota bacterium]|jgi:peptide deformylase